MAVPFPKRLSFSTELPLYFCEKSASHTCVGQFLGPLFCSLDLSNFPPKLYCLNSLSSIVRLEIKKRKSLILLVIVVQLLSHVWLFATPWTTAHQASLSFSISQNLFQLMSVESTMPFNHLVLCYSFVFMPSVFPSIRIFSNESALCIRWLIIYSYLYI